MDECRLGLSFYFIFGFIFFFSSLSTGMDGHHGIIGKSFCFCRRRSSSSVFLFFCSWTRRLPGLSWAAVLDRERERVETLIKTGAGMVGHCLCFFLLSHGPSVASGQLYYKTPALYLYTQGPNCIPFIGQHLAPFVSNRFLTRQSFINSILESRKTNN